MKHRFIDSVNFAIQGILHATRTQKHMRYHFGAALLLLVAVLGLGRWGASLARRRLAGGGLA